MKRFLLAAALFAAPALAHAHTQWWIYEGHPSACEPLEQFIPGHPLHEPADLVAELNREGANPSWQNYPGVNGKVIASSVSISDGTGTYEVDMFTTRALCNGYKTYIAKHPDATPDEAGDKSI